MRRTTATTRVVCGILAVAGAARADDARLLATIDERLAVLKEYDYTRDGGPPGDLEEIVFRLPPDLPLRGAIEQKLIDALGRSGEAGRGAICRLLRVIGTDKCVPAVASLLADPESSHFARYALQAIGSDAALGAMLEAAGRTSGALRVGLVNSLAERRYEPMRAACVALLASDDSEAASAAARALGRLGGTKSVAALTDARTRATGQLALDIDLALLNCAEMLLNEGDSRAAAAIYAPLYTPDGPFRTAALRGRVLAEPDRAAELLAGAIRGQDAVLAGEAIGLVGRVKDGGAVTRLAAVLNDLPADRKVAMLLALGAGGNRAALDAVAAAARSEEEAVRLAALEALGGLAGDEAVDALLQAAVDGTDSARRVARAGLVRVWGAETRLVEVARGSDDRLGAEAVRTLGARRAGGTVALMVELARGDQPLRRMAALDSLGRVAGPAQLGQLIQLAFDPRTPEELSCLQVALGRVLLRIDAPADRAAPLLDALASAPPAARPLLIRHMARAGTPAALAAVREAMNSSDRAVVAAAVSSLADWPDEQAGEALLQVVQSAAEPELKEAALQGYLRIALASDASASMLVDALKRVDGIEMKKLVLKTMESGCSSVEAAGATRSLLDDPQLRVSAAIATARIAKQLAGTDREAACRILNELLATVEEPDARTVARNVLNDIEQYDDHILSWTAVGPFKSDETLNGEQCYKTVFPPENGEASKLDWKPLKAGVNGWDINLEATYGPMDCCAAYVRTMVWSPADQRVQVEGGADDGLKIWVNKELVFDDWNVRGGSPRKMLASARLRQGWNELMLKVVDDTGGWGFGCRVRKPDGSGLEGLRYEAR